MYPLCDVQYQRRLPSKATPLRCPVLTASMLLRIRCTSDGYAAMRCRRACYAMPGTDLARAETRRFRVAGGAACARRRELAPFRGGPVCAYPSREGRR
eukprot:2377213-Rhodomonas_salina.1